MKKARIITETITTIVELVSSRLVDHETFFSSALTSLINFATLFINAFPLFYRTPAPNEEIYLEPHRGPEEILSEESSFGGGIPLTFLH